MGGNIKMDLHELGWGDMERADLAQDRDRLPSLVSTRMNFRFP
jgi:hypothetical protein